MPIQEPALFIATKLQSDKAKDRKAGLESLCGWLNAAPSIDTPINVDPVDSDTNSNSDSSDGGHTYSRHRANGMERHSKDILVDRTCGITKNTDYSDTSWLRIIEAFCRFSDIERSIAITKAEQTTSSRISRAVTGSASTLQLVGETFSRLCEMGSRACPSVISRSQLVMVHIFHTLRCASDTNDRRNQYSSISIDLLRPLRFPYALALRHLLRSCQILGHLTPNMWDSAFVLITDIITPEINTDTDGLTVEKPAIDGAHALNFGSVRQYDRRPDSAELAEALTFLVSGYHIPHIIDRAGDILRTASSYLQKYSGESTMASCMTGIITFVISHIAVDHLDGSLNLLDTVLPFALDLWECRSAILKASIINMARLFFALNSAEGSLEPYTVALVHRLTALLTSDMSTRTSTVAFDLIIYGAIRNSHLMTRLAISSHMNVGRPIQTECIILETDLAATLLCWQLKYAEMLSATGQLALDENESALFQSSSKDYSDEIPRKRRRRLIPSMLKELDSALSRNSQMRGRVVYILALAIAAGRQWDLCSVQIQKHIPNTISALTSSNPQVEKAALLLIHSLVKSVQLHFCTDEIASTALASSSNASPDVVNSNIKASTDSAWMIPEIWTLLISKPTQSVEATEMKLRILSLISSRRLLSDELLVQGFLEYMNSSISGSSCSGVPIEYQFYTALYPVLSRSMVQIPRPLWAPKVSMLADLLSAELVEISADHILDCCRSIFFPLEFMRAPYTPESRYLYNTTFSSNQLLFESIFESICKDIRAFKQLTVTTPPIEGNLRGLSVFNQFPLALKIVETPHDLQLLGVLLADLYMFISNTLSQVSNVNISEKTAFTDPQVMARAIRSKSVLLVIAAITLQEVTQPTLKLLSDSCIAREVQRLQGLLRSLSHTWADDLKTVISNNADWSTDLLRDISGWLYHMVPLIPNQSRQQSKDDKGLHLVWPLDISIVTNIMLSITESTLISSQMDTTFQKNSDLQGEVEKSNSKRINRELRGIVGAGLMFEVEKYGELADRVSHRHTVMLKLAKALCRSLGDGVLSPNICSSIQEFLLVYLQSATTVLLDGAELISCFVEISMHLEDGFLCYVLTVLLKSLERYSLEKCDQYAICCMKIANVIFPIIITKKDTLESHREYLRAMNSLSTFVRFMVVQGTAKQLSANGISSLFDLIFVIMDSDPRNTLVLNIYPVKSLIELLVACGFHLKLMWSEQVVPRIFGSTPVLEYTRIYNEIAQRLPKEPADDAELISTCAIYSAVAIASNAICTSAIASMLKLATKYSDGIVSDILGELSAKLGFKSTTSFISTLLPTLIHDVGGVFSFPWSVFGDGLSEQQYFEKYLETLIPFAVKENCVDRLLSQLCDAKEVLSNKLGVIYGALLPLSFDANYGSTTLVVIKTILGICGLDYDADHQKLCRYSSAVFQSIFLQMTGLQRVGCNYGEIDPIIISELQQLEPWTVPENSTPCLCFFSEMLSVTLQNQQSNIYECIQALSMFSSSVNSCSVSDLLKPQRLQKILHRLHHFLQADALSLHRRNLLLNGYSMLFVMSGDSWFHPFIFRSTLQFLLKQASHEVTLGVCFGILAHMAKKTCLLNLSENLLANLGFVCTTLSKICVDYQRRGISTPNCSTNVYHFLTSDVPSSEVSNWAAQSCVDLLELLLSLSIKGDSDTFQLALLNIDTTNPLFVDMLKKYSSSEMSIQVLKKSLLENIIQSPSPLRYLQQSFDGYTPLNWLSEVETMRLISILWDFATQPSSALDEICIEASKSLAKLAVFAPNRFFTQYNGSLIREHSFTRMDQSSPLPETCLEGQVVALRFLAKMLLDEDLEVVSTAIKTLAIVATNELVELVSTHLTPQEIAFLNLFAGRRHAEYAATFQTIACEGLEVCSLFKNGRSPETWSLEVAKSLLATYSYDSVYSGLVRLFEMKPDFADLMIPYLFHFSLFAEIGKSDSARVKLSATLNAFLSKATKDDEYAISKIIHVIHFLSHCKSSHINSQYEWLDLNYAQVAKAAALFDPLEALFFIEIHHSTLEASIPCVEASTWSTLQSCFGMLGDVDGFDGVVAHYRHNVDAILIQKYEHGREWGKLVSTLDTNLQGLANGSHLGQQTSLSVSLDHLHLCRALGHSGQYHLLETVLESISHKNIPGTLLGSSSSDLNFHTSKAEFSELQYECFWRMGRWDKSIVSSDSKGADASLFASLRALHILPLELTTRDKLLQALANVAIDRRTFPDLLCIVEAIEVHEMIHTNSDGIDRIFSNWTARVKMATGHSSFEEIERLLTFRTQLLFTMRSESSKLCSNFEKIDKYLANHLVDLSHRSLKNRQFHSSRQSIQWFETMSRNNMPLESLYIEITKLKLHWLRGDQAMAIGLLQDLLKEKQEYLSTPSQEIRNAHACILRLLGKWSSQNQTQSPQMIVKQYLLPASDIRSQIGVLSVEMQPSLNAKEYYQLARFCDEILKDMESDDLHIHAVQLLLDRQAELRQYFLLEQTTKDKHGRIRIARAKAKLEKQIDIDQAEANRRDREMYVYLKLSIQNYMSALIYSTRHAEETLFRFCSLWFSHSNNIGLQDIVARRIDFLPPRKFLILMYQISARLMSSTIPSTGVASGSISEEHQESRFYELLEHLIMRIIKDYPYHSLPHIIALKNGTVLKSDISRRSSRGNSLSEDAHSLSLEKGTVENPARRVLAKISSTSTTKSVSVQENLCDIVHNLNYLFDLYMQVADFKHDKNALKNSRQGKSSRGYLFDTNLEIVRFKGNISLPVLTLEQPIGDPGFWGDIVHITGFEKSYTLPGGINAPKTVKCRGSDGRVYQQLVKGNEDLRQDAVLSSIFNMANILLLKNYESRKRCLKIRTYRIVPMSPQTGVIQWVDGTLPIGTILVDAHQRYRKSDISTLECRKIMMDEHERQGSDPVTKLMAYRGVMDKFKPIFSKLLLDMYTDARAWLESRTRYTRSVAASSMAGYIVGLGDRHAQNILFDCKTAEVVHIDLGIAFDQGKLLSVPELVPFRLSRDLVNCMGMTGIEGGFRRGCEETLRVFRAESRSILMLLDVFLHDPLYNWKISPLKLRHLQKKNDYTSGGADRENPEQNVLCPQQTNRSKGMISSPLIGKIAKVKIDFRASHVGSLGSEEAARAIFGVHKKLSSTLGIECQVSQLISAAVDHENLSRMFPGW
ncbi:hypothetical protein BASA60_002773 [Batrachochytrium salamandrivorans]|nr:hypothetical protein BASA62_000664 [Batrachochytrium salamandrivorans]KAH6580702.1 hypothetical protein BASA60_002773 [Batrachochytrium salamandrivorans]KAH9273252.1 hypothetical protein BASA83_004541 [Batrachochytrium salamandrivorans]